MSSQTICFLLISQYRPSHTQNLYIIVFLSKYYSGAQGGYLKCSIRGTNNELRNKFCKFVHLQLFSVKCKFVHLQLFDVKLFFPEKHIFREQKRTVCYGRASVISDFKLTRKNNDLLYLRHKQFFEVPLSVHEYTKIQIPAKSI